MKTHMVKSVIRLLLKSGLQELGLEISEEKAQQFELFVNELKKWNRKVNLTTITSNEDIVVKHLIDSVFVANHIQEEESVLDIGSGAGFPAIPLKIMKPEVRLVSVDAVNKKILFQRHVSRLLNFESFEAVHARVEKISAAYPQGFDVITSRAFSQIDQFVTLGAPLLAEGGRMLAMKGPAAIDELNTVEGTLRSLDFKISQVLPYFLPMNKGERNLITIKRCEAP